MVRAHLVGFEGKRRFLLQLSARGGVWIALRGGECCGQVVAEVLGDFESDVEPDKSGRVRQGGEGAQVVGHGRHDQALKPAPNLCRG